MKDMSIVLEMAPTAARPLVETALADQGFGVLTEIDVADTLKRKLDVDVPAQVILGACNPHLAHEALGLEPSVGLLLPCNVVLRADGEGRTVVSVADPTMLVTVTGNPALEGVAARAREKLARFLEGLAEVRGAVAGP